MNKPKKVLFIILAVVFAVWVIFGVYVYMHNKQIHNQNIKNITELVQKNEIKQNKQSEFFKKTPDLTLPAKCLISGTIFYLQTIEQPGVNCAGMNCFDQNYYLLSLAVSNSSDLNIKKTPPCSDLVNTSRNVVIFSGQKKESLKIGEQIRAEVTYGKYMGPDDYYYYYSVNNFKIIESTDAK